MTQTTQGRPVRTVRVRGGKEYVEVSERVRIAHEEGGYTTLEPLVYNIGDRWFYRAGIIVDGETFYGTAEIKFGAPRGTADGDAPIECAETSAYGRAFAFAGIGILDGIASADEVRRVAPAAQPQAEQQPRTAPQSAPVQQATATILASFRRDVHLRKAAAMAGYPTEAAFDDFMAEATGGDLANATREGLMAYAEQRRKAKAS